MNSKTIAAVISAMILVSANASDIVNQ